MWSHHFNCCWTSADSGLVRCVGQVGWPSTSAVKVLSPFPMPPLVYISHLIVRVTIPIHRSLYFHYLFSIRCTTLCRVARLYGDLAWISRPNVQSHPGRSSAYTFSESSNSDASKSFPKTVQHPPLSLSALSSSPRPLSSKRSIHDILDVAFADPPPFRLRTPGLLILISRHTPHLIPSPLVSSPLLSFPLSSPPPALFPLPLHNSTALA